MNIRVQCLRILLSSFGEQDFQMFALNSPYCFGYHFTENVGETPFEQTLITPAQGLFVGNF